MRISTVVMHRLNWFFVYLKSKNCILLLLFWQNFIRSSWPPTIPVGPALEEKKMNNEPCSAVIWVFGKCPSRKVIFHAFMMIDKWNHIFKYLGSLEPNSHFIRRKCSSKSCFINNIAWNFYTFVKVTSKL